MEIQNLSTGARDPFAVGDQSDDKGATAANHVHIRTQQRTGKKSLTTVSGLSTQFDYKRLLKHWKKHFSCNGTILNDDNHGCIIQVSGDKRAEISQFLIDEGIVEREHLKVHGA
eukprot:GHVR01108943.1.p1 GENE.GHVR01108943.1~~GHVR01108943.1.p1  ORF type:complete len:114 (-),score=27.30 GHVR01108943.1:375-716(-)